MSEPTDVGKLQVEHGSIQTCRRSEENGQSGTTTPAMAAAVPYVRTITEVCETIASKGVKRTRYRSTAKQFPDPIRSRPTTSSSTPLTLGR